MGKLVTINPQMRYVLSEKEYNDLVALANANEAEIMRRVADLWESQSEHDLTITLRMVYGGHDQIIEVAELSRVSLFAYKDDNETRKEQRQLVASKIKEMISEWYDKEYGDVAYLRNEAHRRMRCAKLLWRTYWIAGIVGLLTALILKFVC